MVWTPVLAFAAIAAVFGVGDIISAKTRGMVSSLLVAILMFLLFGGALKLLPPDLMNQSGLMTLIPAFGMALILVNVGSLLNLNDLKSEWKTVIVSVAGVLGVVVIGLTVGSFAIGRELALAAMSPTAGGIAATMMLTEAANQAQRLDIAAFVAAVMALQILIGMPISSICLRKEADRFMRTERGKSNNPEPKSKDINFRLIPSTPKFMDIPTLHLARLAVVGVLAQMCSKATGISTGLTFLVFGIVFAAIGFLEKGSLGKAGGEGILMLATYASIAAGFVGMTFAQFGQILLPVLCFLLMSAAGIILLSSVVGKFLGWSVWLSIPVGLACMFGYPATYAIAMEVSAGAAKDMENAEEEKGRLVKHLLPKMLIAGVVSVSISSVILAGIIIPVLFP